jgi:hypothetical protein
MLLVLVLLLSESVGTILWLVYQPTLFWRIRVKETCFSLKGTEKRDFQPSVFFIKQSPLGP